jgi:hypothetical protein
MLAITKTLPGALSLVDIFSKLVDILKVGNLDVDIGTYLVPTNDAV